MKKSLGVGFIGGGFATQAIHIPTLARMPDVFHVECVMDANSEVASKVSARCGGRGTTSVEDVISDPRIDVVAICSPNQFHADQVIAACEAGKRAVLCEKPLAVTRDELVRVKAASAASGVPVIVGTMHAYDPAYRAARAAWQDLGETADFVQSHIYIPLNALYVNQATDTAVLETTVAPRRPPLDLSTPKAVSDMIRFAILGLAIHDLPILRGLNPATGKVLSADFIEPFGYAITLADEHKTIELLAYMGGHWAGHWNVRGIGKQHEFSIAFPPSYVLSGSARAEIIGSGQRNTFQDDVSGYQAIWSHIDDVVNRDASLLFEMPEIVADLEYALDIADSVESTLTGKI